MKKNNIVNFSLIVLNAFCLLPVAGVAQNITDGPYVFYKNDRVIVKSVVNKNGHYIADSSGFSLTDRPGHMLQVHLDGHPEWDFTVRLRGQINNEPVCSPGASKIFAVSDIEGEFEPFRNLLLQAHVIDGQYNWIFGKGSLIIAGDLFDRGKQVSQYLWLLYKLEDEARAKGGVVHVVLGNHEIMNLSGDIRYVQPEYFNNCRLMNEAYVDLYSDHTELGRWLRSKNIIEKDGDFLVLHGGVAQAVNEFNMPLDEINRLCRPWYAVPRKEISTVNVQPFFSGTTSPFWYRGYFLDPKASQAQIDSTLRIYKVKEIWVGHDIIHHVSRLYNDKVVGLDVDEHEGTHEGLLMLNNKYYRVDDKGLRTLL